MLSAQGNQWMMIFILATVCYQEVSAGSGPVRVTRSAVTSLRDPGTYLIRFKDNATEEELQQFTATLMKSASKTVEIIEELFIIKYLTARLSGRALSWVRTMLNCL